MNYTKPPLSFAEQAARLIGRGLISDEQALVQRLSIVNYYRLSAYWYIFKRTDPVTGEEGFAPNTTFEMVWRRYVFDRDLRRLMMEAVEHVEIAILRTRLVEQFSRLHGPFGYGRIDSFSPDFPLQDHARLLSEIDDGVARSKEEFVRRFRRKYSSEPRLPLWIAVEVMTFGQLFTLFRYLNRDEQQSLAQQFRLYPPVMRSWLHTLNFIRNACAHHARLWNRELPIRPLIPDERHNPEWHSPLRFDNRRIFSVLTLLRYLLGYLETGTSWQAGLEALLQAYPDVPPREMGIPSDWRESAIWK